MSTLLVDNLPCLPRYQFEYDDFDDISKQRSSLPPPGSSGKRKSRIVPDQRLSSQQGWYVTEPEYMLPTF